MSPNPAAAPARNLERYLIGALLLAWLVLRVAYAFHFRIDDDEPQHLHVVWGWATGQLPYRDFFDNHGPLFHPLCVPLFRALGQRADILIPMRLAMIPLAMISLWCVYRLGRTIFSPRVGRWAALIAAFYPEFFLTSTEFRTDNLWTVLWLTALTVATSGLLSASRLFVFGLLIGAAFSVTVKTGLMVGSVGLAAAFVLAGRWKSGEALNWMGLGRQMAAAVAGFVIVPLAATLFFTFNGALEPFLYCNIFHNLVPHTQNWKHLDAHLLWFPVVASAVTVLFFRWKPAPVSRTHLQRAFIALTGAFYFSALKSFFPTLSRQDDLPLLPLLAIFIAALAVSLPERLAAWQRRPALGQLLAPLCVALEIALLVVGVPFWRNDTKGEIAELAHVLRVSRPSEFVMDNMGQTIYRRRPFYYALEAFTKVRIEKGLIKDDIAETLVASGTAVVRPQGLTQAARTFVRENYVNISSNLCILGKVLKRPSAGPIEFTLPIGGRFVIVDKHGTDIQGTLDGQPYAGPRTLPAGPHSFLPQGPSDNRIAIFWADAYERGTLPFD